MIVRVAACAAWFFVWPVCTGIAGGASPSPETVAIARTTDSPSQKIDGEKQATPQAEPFGLAAKPVSYGEIFRKWRGVQPEIRNDTLVLARCRKTPAGCPQAARDFLSIIDEGRAHTGRARIGVINRAINLAIIPTSDIVQWGVVDRWSSPLETFTTRRGDCEDYAIAKYVALRAAGVPQQDIRLIVVRNIAPNENHAVVAVRLDGAWVILDNRWLALVSDRELSREIPLFVIGEDGVRQFLAPSANAALPEGVPGAVSVAVSARH